MPKTPRSVVDPEDVLPDAPKPDDVSGEATTEDKPSEIESPAPTPSRPAGPEIIPDDAAPVADSESPLTIVCNSPRLLDLGGGYKYHAKFGTHTISHPEIIKRIKPLIALGRDAIFIADY